MVLVSSADHTSELWRQRPLHAQRAEGRRASGVGYSQTTRSHAQHVKKRAEENTWVSTWTGEQLVGNRHWRAMECDGERLMECHDDRKRRTQALDKPRHHTAKDGVYGARGARLTLSRAGTMGSEYGSTAQVSRLGEHEQMDDPDEKKSKERTHSG